MTDDNPVMIAVAPNGARKTRQDHPKLPITPRELAAVAASCLDAGACMLHLHVRDAALRHSLNADAYIEASNAIRRKLGSELIIQITTEAVGCYQPAEQMQVVRDVKPEAVSLASREICPAATDETTAAEFFSWLQRERIAPQYILYSVEDIQYFSKLRQRGIIPQQNPAVLLVLGRYTQNQQSEAEDLKPLLLELGNENCWWLCAFGANEAECMLAAAAAGGHCRVGFENNMQLADGSIASTNETLVRLLVSKLQAAGLEIATPAQAREFMNVR